MFKVQCISKNQRMEGQNVVTDVNFIPYMDNQNQQNGQMYATGAAIGTPNAPNPSTGEVNIPQVPEQPKFALTSGFGFTIRDAKESGKYEVGKVYSLNMTANEVEEPKQAQAPKQAAKQTEKTQ